MKSYNTWFWLHPSAYKLINYGNTSLIIIWMIIMTYLTKYIILKTIFIIIALTQIYKLYKKIKYAQKYLTFYDIYLRDYD